MKTTVLCDNELAGDINSTLWFLGLSATFEGQLKKILDTLTVAIQQSSPTRNMSTVSPEAIMKKIEMTLEEKARKAALASSSPSDGSVLAQSLDPKRAAKAKKDLEKEEGKWCDPDDIPVVVIDGYMSREKGPHAKELWTFIADWAAVLVENHVAHVVFISNNIAASKPLSKGITIALIQPGDHSVLFCGSNFRFTFGR